MAAAQRDPNHPVGVIRHSTFGQGEYWWDRRARRHRIVEMPLDYLLNLISFLERHDEGFYGAELMITAGERLTGIDAPPGWPAAGRCASACDWLHATPLLRSLVAAADAGLTKPTGQPQAGLLRAATAGDETGRGAIPEPSSERVTEQGRARRRHPLYEGLYQNAVAFLSGFRPEAERDDGGDEQ